MATFSAADLNTKARHMGGYGNTVTVYGTVAPTAGALADVFKPVRIPAGVAVTGLRIVNDDLAASALAVKIGYEPVNAADGPTADDDYFAAAGNTLLLTAGTTQLAFQPIKFEKDVFVTITVTTAAVTFATGNVTAIVTGDGIGIK